MDDNYDSVGLDFFYGGMSQDKQIGTKGQFYYAKHFDFRKNPSKLTLLPNPTKADGGIVTDLVQAMTQITSGVRYSLGDSGKIYKTATNGTWSDVGDLSENGGAGIIYRADVDHIYVTGTSKIARISRMTTTGSFEQNWFKNGISSSTTCYKTGGTAAYTPPVTLTETQKRSFTADIEPLYRIGIKVNSKGTGDWTLVLHDDANNQLGSVTVTSANLSNNAINYFTFSSPIRIQRGDSGAGSALTYHYHITSTVADGTMATTTASTLSDCDMELWANALVTTQNGLHPIINFLNFTLIGNGRYVLAYEPLQDSPTTADLNRHRITLPPGFEVTSFAQKNLLCVIAAEKRSSSGEFQEGALFFWDGISTGYNDWWPVPEGSPESLFSYLNTVYYIAGGGLYRISGTDVPRKIRTFRNTDSEYSSVADTTHVYPNCMTVRRGVLLIGYPSTTTNQSLEHGVYSLGAVSDQYPESFGFSYTTSNASILNNGSNNLRIGMVKSYGDTVYISWRDDASTPHAYGVDVVNNSSTPAPDGTIELLNFNDQRSTHYKKAGYILATFDTLPAGVSVTCKYRIDGDTSWTPSGATTSGKWIVFPVNKLFLNIDFALDVAFTGTTTPSINSLHLFYDPQKKERPVG